MSTTRAGCPRRGRGGCKSQLCSNLRHLVSHHRASHRVPPRPTSCPTAAAAVTPTNF
ncbi:hypothetical protein JYU34_006237 [Plutella xylostella]|uniref:Uncharacterized protein n=1 Tax=Plutella xylostella TaxID=51655 RepID=A0ABQ7QV99_PLUXY|nr:hypothetical protein JYU34_006237 [Plutella xylostella]